MWNRHEEKRQKSIKFTIYKHKSQATECHNDLNDQNNWLLWCALWLANWPNEGAASPPVQPHPWSSTLHPLQRWDQQPVSPGPSPWSWSTPSCQPLTDLPPSWSRPNRTSIGVRVDSQPPASSPPGQPNLIGFQWGVGTARPHPCMNLCTRPLATW